MFEFLATSYIEIDEHAEGGCSASVSLLFISGTFNCPVKQKRNRDTLLSSCIHGNASYTSVKLPELRFLGLGILSEF